ncbi:MAG: CRISPR-associated endonuclease Cas1 [Bradyrhizobium icense]|nr:MAG: CRISPR-associated endonuclease Cas1 [Bradyrhizobium icense]
MSKKPYDFLSTEKEPFFYIEKGMICMHDGFLCVVNGKEGRVYLSPAGILVLVLGHGTSITQEAAIFAAESDMQICFSRGRFNMHSIFMSGRYQDPYPLRNQISKTEQYRLEYGKLLLRYRFSLLKHLSPQVEMEIAQLSSVQNILLYEARWAKTIYKDFAVRYQVQNFNRTFEFKKSSTAADLVNERLNVLNNVFYSVCTSVILATNLSPSIAILHGESRRGGLAFDLADLFKTSLIFDLAFKQQNITIKELMYKLSSRLKENDQWHLKKMIAICLSIGEDNNTLAEVLKI